MPSHHTTDMLGVWDTSENAQVTRKFINPNYTPPPPAEGETEKKGKNARKKARGKFKK